MTAIDELVKLLKKLPGMGEKSATRLTYHLLATDKNFNKSLGEAISSIQDKIHPCPICGCYSEGEKCPYCDDDKRDKSILCVVEQAQDTVSIAQSGVYNGLFHVLGGAINPINGIGPSSLRLKELKERIATGEFKEVIIATNPTEEGDTTALYIRQLLSPFENITLTRLASGIPIGGDLGYVDKMTLARSMRGRIKL
ncbi:MAG: recombination mediator RecR [Spirochaetales bacterium]|nr:recombination mediator RecR [Spirochaetales bacterium]